MGKGVYRMAWPFNPLEVSPLDIRSVTVLPRALLEVSPDPPCGATTTTQQQHNNPANINSPLQTSPPGWFVNPFGQPLTLILFKTGYLVDLWMISNKQMIFGSDRFDWSYLELRSCLIRPFQKGNVSFWRLLIIFRFYINYKPNQAPTPLYMISPCITSYIGWY